LHICLRQKNNRQVPSRHGLGQFRAVDGGSYNGQWEKGDQHGVGIEVIMREGVPQEVCSKVSLSLSLSLSFSLSLSLSLSLFHPLSFSRSSFTHPHPSPWWQFMAVHKKGERIEKYPRTDAKSRRIQADIDVNRPFPLP